GDSEEEDRRQAEALLADPKERAEHVMLVDLGRNDLGRVCAAGSVTVPEFMTVQRFSHVMHLVSRVTGSLAAGRDAFDLLRAAFPAGTVSGAPKIRAMQIIDELEASPRGLYAGAVCYVDYSGNLDSCIIIRTMVSRGRSAWVQAGGGIVADSDPAREHQETINKARAVLTAIEQAGRRVR
ncbi:MAG TPA: anthranilate synthase component I family protein, partial [Candidatus Polarisedimenticolia bacterium]|nr:anthranilate synthase component I family protein [Candidatus Polarisedimenticolia bacterium]